MRETNERHGGVGGGPDRTRTALTLSASVLAGLVVVFAGRGLVEQPAAADVASVGSLIVTNLKSGTNEDVVAMLDGREERLFVYQTTNMKDVKLVATEDLRDLFAKAKAAASGNR